MHSDDKVAIFAVVSGLLFVAVFAFGSDRQAAKRDIPPPKDTQFAVMVWDETCITVLEKTRETKITAPMRPDGTPDMHHAHVTGIAVSLDIKCGHIDIRRGQQ